METERTYENYDTGEEETFTFPAKHEVCSRCGGHGTHLNPSIGSHAYSGEEFDEAFEPGSEEREHYFKRGGMYDVRCEVCNGKNVVLVIDEERCTSDEQKAALKTYTKYQRRREREDAEDRRTTWYESGCPMD